MITFVDQDSTFQRHDHGTILLEASGFDPYDSHMWPGLGFAGAQDFGLGVDCIPFENGGGDVDLFPTQVDPVFGYIAYAEAYDDRQG